MLRNVFRSVRRTCIESGAIAAELAAQGHAIIRTGKPHVASAVQKGAITFHALWSAAPTSTHFRSGIVFVKSPMDRSLRHEPLDPIV
jgi:hypothetical protein